MSVKTTLKALSSLSQKSESISKRRWMSPIVSHISPNKQKMDFTKKPKKDNQTNLYSYLKHINYQQPQIYNLRPNTPNTPHYPALPPQYYTMGNCLVTIPPKILYYARERATIPATWPIWSANQSIKSISSRFISLSISR